MKKFYTVLLLVSLCSYSQNASFKIPDSIQQKGFRYLEDRLYELKNDSTGASIYLFSYLRKAKLEKNWRELQNGYQNMLHHSPSKIRLVYADSMLYAAKKTKDNAAIGSAFLTKGVVFYAEKQYKAALDEYLIANEYITKTNDQYLIYKVKYNIAQIKICLGLYNEAISLFSECASYYKKNHSRPYLNSLHSLGLSYNKAGNYGMCSQTNEEGLIESEKRSIPEMSIYFRHSEGVNQYFLKNFTKAIDILKSEAPNLINNGDFANEAVGNFYIAKSYWELKKKEDAVPYFTKIDQIFNDKQFTRIDFLETYKLLIDYYKTKDNLELQLYYVNQLLKAIHLLNETNSYLSSKVHTGYDLKTYRLEKQKIEEALNNRKNNDLIFISIVTLLILIILLLAYRYFKIRSNYKINFEALMNKTVEQKKEVSKISSVAIPGINSSVEVLMVKQLEKWEHGNKFLNPDITLVKLAATFDSNTKYLSFIIFHYRHKKFISYINDLKIDYLIIALTGNKRLQQYTNEALAKEIGFSTTQRFASAFLARTKMPPTYFIAQIVKKEAKTML